MNKAVAHVTLHFTKLSSLDSDLLDHSLSCGHYSKIYICYAFNQLTATLTIRGWEAFRNFLRLTGEIVLHY